MNEFRYPQASRLDLTEDILGHQVSDPYRWLEDDTNAERAGWLAAQADLFGSYREELPGRDRLAARVRELLSTGYVGTPAWRGERLFYTRRDPGAEHGVLCTQAGHCIGRGSGGGARRPDGHRPVRADHAGRLAAGQGGAAAGLPAVRGRRRGVAAAGDRRGDRRAGGRADRPVPVFERGLAAGRQGLLLHPQAAAGGRCRTGRASITGGSTCTRSARRRTRTCSSSARAGTRPTTTASRSAGTGGGWSSRRRGARRRATTCGSPTCPNPIPQRPTCG